MKTINKEVEKNFNDLKKLYGWSKKWQMQINTEKCPVSKLCKTEMKPD